MFSDPKNLVKEFNTELTRAKKAKTFDVARKMKRERWEGIRDHAWNRRKIGGQGSGISPRRRSAVRTIIGKNGTFTFADWAPLARAQEFGEVIRKKGSKPMYISDKRNQGRRPGGYFTDKKTGNVFFKPKNRTKASKSKGTKVDRRFKPRYVGKFVDQVKIRRFHRAARMTVIAEKYIDDYREALIRALSSDER